METRWLPEPPHIEDCVPDLSGFRKFERYEKWYNPVPTSPHVVPDMGWEPIKKYKIKPPLHQAVYDYDRTRQLLVENPRFVKAQYKGRSALDRAIAKSVDNINDDVIELLYSMGTSFYRWTFDLGRVYETDERWLIIFKYIVSTHRVIWTTGNTNFIERRMGPDCLQLFLNDGPTLAQRCLFVLECTRIKQEIEEEHKIQCKKA